MLLSKLLIQYDAQQASLPSFRAQTQFSVPPTHTWRKCRIAAPKTSPHHGVVRSSTGIPCTTTATLDQALRATRHFWQDLLQHMTRNGSPSFLPTPPNVTLPPLSPPSHPSLYHAVITSPDSAPGADGIPYSAWRICPRITAQALDNHLQSILTRTASPPLQSLVFIPKADQGEYADNYRPLGLPNTCDRILDRSIYSPFSHCLLGALHPAQALLNLFREPQFNYLDIQHFLDNAMHLHSVLLSDLAKAFERVNSHWIMHVLVARATPYWILAYCRHTYTKLNPTLDPLLQSTMESIWEGPSAFSYFASLWTPGTIMFIAFPGFSLTGDIWMTMPQVALAYNGFLKHRNSLTASPPQDYWYSPTPATNLNCSPLPPLPYHTTKYSLMSPQGFRRFSKPTLPFPLQGLFASVVATVL